MKRSIFATLCSIILVSQVSICSALTSRNQISTRLSPEVQSIASESTYCRGVSIACRASDGTNLNQAFGSHRITLVPHSLRGDFISFVKSQSLAIASAISNEDVALICDEILDYFEFTYPSIYEYGEAAEPICWSDITAMNRCAGTDDDGILSGFDALISGY